MVKVLHHIATVQKKIYETLLFYLFPIGDIDAEIDVSKTAGTDLPDETVLAAYDELRPRCRWSTRHLRN